MIVIKSLKDVFIKAKYLIKSCEDIEISIMIQDHHHPKIKIFLEIKNKILYKISKICKAR